MRTIQCWRDLDAFGFNLLTAEACGLGYRYLVDLTDEGKNVVEKLFDVEMKMPANWNCGAISSIMLPHEMLVPIGIFALLESGCSEVWLNHGALIGIEGTDDPTVVEAAIARCQRRFSYVGTAGSRNRHLISGRIQ